jgi:hypothetical protein
MSLSLCKAIFCLDHIGEFCKVRFVISRSCVLCSVNEKIFKKYAGFFGRCCGCFAVVVENLDSIATQTTTGTSQSKTQSKGTSKSTSSVASANSGAEKGDTSTDSRF